MTVNKRCTRILILVAALIITVISLGACGGSGNSGESVLSEYPKADMSGYAGLRGVKSTTEYADLTVKDLKQLMDNGESFALYVGYADCPWCNTLIPYVSSVAEKYGGIVGYLDARKDPTWKSNMDITNYDVFVELFDEYIRLDEEKKKHLYVPVVYFVKGGKAVTAHEGVVDGLENPDDMLSEDQEKELEGILSDGFKKTT